MDNTMQVFLSTVALQTAVYLLQPPVRCCVTRCLLMVITVLLLLLVCQVPCAPWEDPRHLLLQCAGQWRHQQ